MTDDFNEDDDTTCLTCGGRLMIVRPGKHQHADIADEDCRPNTQPDTATDQQPDVMTAVAEIERLAKETGEYGCNLIAGTEHNRETHGHDEASAEYIAALVNNAPLLCRTIREQREEIERLRDKLKLEAEYATSLHKQSWQLSDAIGMGEVCKCGHDLGHHSDISGSCLFRKSEQQDDGELVHVDLCECNQFTVEKPLHDVIAALRERVAELEAKECCVASALLVVPITPLSHAHKCIKHVKVKGEG